MKAVTLTLKLALVALVSATFAGSAPAQNRIPQFKDHSVSDRYIGKTARLALTRDDRMFKTRLAWAAKNQRPNFAGHYILTSWGCGTTCLMGAIIDAKTGKVYWWNFSICCWSSDVATVFLFYFKEGICDEGKLPAQWCRPAYFR